jgi:hypothetical protein
LQPEDAGEIFKAKELSDSEHWKELIQRYQGNPLYLKIAATSIQELFQGKVSEFSSAVFPCLVIFGCCWSGSLSACPI